MLTTSFLNAPVGPATSGTRAAILGCPFDHGTAMRIGARLGPSAIRTASHELGPYDPGSGLNLIEALRLMDCGDAEVVPSHVESSFAGIERASQAILSQGCVPVSMGGDGMVSLPQLRAAARQHGPLALVHIDAHSDTYPQEGYNTATTFARAAEEGLLDIDRSCHIGLRGTSSDPGAWSHPEALGFALVTMAELRAGGVPKTADAVLGRAGDAACYFCFDMDFFDGSIAPGVCNPVYGGASVAEGFALIEALAGLNVVTYDVNTVSPPHDVQNMTALLAATVMVMFLQQIAAKA